MILTDDEFRLFSQLIYDESGIALRHNKKEFLQARLVKRIEANRLGSYYRYYKFITDKTRGQRELLDLMDSLTINETSFFRNKPQFDLFTEHVLPDLMKKRADGMTLRFWSAGCSRGQEPYSIAISVLSSAGFPSSWDVRILASDISLRALESAVKGVYGIREIDNIDQKFLERYFERKGDQYEVKQHVKRLVVFDYHNLKHDNGQTGLDAVFCRNVMIYFDAEEQMRLVDKFHKSLAAGGYLFLGHTESLQGLSDRFKFIYRNKGAVYQKAE